MIAASTDWGTIVVHLSNCANFRMVRLPLLLPVNTVKCRRHGFWFLVVIATSVLCFPPAGHALLSRLVAVFSFVPERIGDPDQRSKRESVEGVEARLRTKAKANEQSFESAMQALGALGFDICSLF